MFMSTLIPQSLNPLNLECLPLDVIVEILCLLDSFGDLQALVIASPACATSLRSLANSTVTQIARNIIGDDAWEEASAVIAHQRGTNRIPKPTEEVQEPKFLLHIEDIRQLRLNQWLFKTCFGHFTRMSGQEANTSPDVTSDTARVNFLNPSPVAGVLTIKSFYQLWLLNLHFQHESIINFSLLEPLTVEQTHTLALLSQVISRFVTSTYNPRNQIYFEPSSEKCLNTVFNSCTNYLNIGIYINTEPCDNPLLLFKLIDHLYHANIWNPETVQVPMTRSTVVNMMEDYKNMPLEEVVEKYHLYTE